MYFLCLARFPRANTTRHDGLIAQILFGATQLVHAFFRSGGREAGSVPQGGRDRQREKKRKKEGMRIIGTGKAVAPLEAQNRCFSAALWHGVLGKMVVAAFGARREYGRLRQG